MHRNNKLVALIAIVIALFVIWQTTIYFQHRGKIGVEIEVVPGDSALKIDNVNTKPGKKYLMPGSHRLIASRIGFTNDTKTINTADITKGEIIYMLPGANSQVAKSYLSQHPDIQQQREAAGGAESERLRSLLLKRYPIISKLPHENLHYKIDYSVDSNQKISLTVTTYGVINGPADYSQYVQQTKAYKQEALDYLKQADIQSNTYPITYIPNL